MSGKSLKGGKKTVYGPKAAPREVRPRAKKALTQGEVAARQKAIKARNAELIRLRKAGTITSEEYRIGINRLKNDLELLRTAVEEENQARHAKVAEAAAVAERRKAEAADRARATAGARGDAETGDAKTMRGKRGRVKTKFLKDKIIASDGYINLDIARDAVKNGEITQTDMDVLVEKAHKKQPSGKTHNEEIRARRISDAVIQGRAEGIGPANIRDRGASGVQIHDATPADMPVRGLSANVSDNVRAAIKHEAPGTVAKENAVKRAANKKAAPKKAAPPKPPKPPEAERPVAPVEAPTKPKRAPRAKKAAVEPPKPVTPPKRAPRVKKAAAEPVKPVEVVKAEAKAVVAGRKTGKVVVPKSAKQIKVTPTLRIKTKAGTGNQAAGPKRVTSQKLAANERAALASRPGPTPRHQYEGKPKVEPTKVTKPNAAQRAKIRKASNAAELEQTRAIAKKAITDKVGKAPGAVRAKVAAPKQSARVTGAMGKVDTGAGAKAAGSIRKGMSDAERLSKLKTGAKVGARVAGKALATVGVAGLAYDIAKRPDFGVKDMAAWQKSHPGYSKLDLLKAATKNAILGDPAAFEPKAGPKRSTKAGPARPAPTGGVRGKGTGGALQRAKKAPVSVPNVPRSPSVKTGTKAPQKPAVGVLGASTHVVKRGDTLWDIAKDNKTTVGSLLKANPTIAERRAKGQTSIFSGTKVHIPKGK